MLTLHSPSGDYCPRTVILGSGGFVGQACACALTASQIPVIGITRQDIDLLAPDVPSILAQRLRVDDCLIIAAASAPCKTTTQLFDNVRMMHTICAALRQQPVEHVIYISSDAVYRDSDGALSESSCAEPGSLHGAMHLTREIMLRTELLQTSLACVRPTLIYGAADPHNGYGPNRFLRLALSGEDIKLFGQGEEQRDHIHIADVADLVRRCVLYRASGIVNAITGATLSFRAIAELCLELCRSEGRMVVTPRVGAMPHGGYRPFDPALLRAIFPDYHPRSLVSGLDHMLRTLRSSNNLSHEDRPARQL